MRRAGAALLLLLAAAACGPRVARPAPPSNDLLIVGYDREPDTLNRFSTHILEDIQTCIVEGLTTTDEQMRIVPLLATGIPTLENGGVALRPDGGMDVTWRLRPNVSWHDGVPFTSADVQFTVQALNSPDYNPESTDGFDRISLGGHARPADRRRPLPRSLRAVRDAVHPRRAPEAPARGARHRPRDRTTTATRSAPARIAWPSGGAASTSCSSGCRITGGASGIRRSDASCSSSSRTPTPASTSSDSGEATSSRWCPGTSTARSRRPRSHRRPPEPGNAYEHITLNEAAVPAVPRRARPARADPRGRPPLIARTILDGLAPVIDGPIQPLSWAYTPRCGSTEYDPAQARALLEEAGWTRGRRRRRARQGRPPARLHAHHPGGVRHPRERGAGGAAAVARRRRGREAWSCTTGRRSARCGSRGGSTRCCTGGRCRRSRR